MIPGIERMQLELVKESLRHAYQEAVNTLIASGSSEWSASIVGIEALGGLFVDLMREWTAEHTRRAE